MNQNYLHDKVETQKPEVVFDAELSAEMAKRTDKLNDTTIDLALRLKQAREFMAWSNAHMRKEWLDWQDQANEAVRDMTQFRMAYDREIKSIKSAAKDVSDFFNSAEYLKAHDKLADMVTLLDRFAELKSNGTLDAFADFILKVSCK